MLIHANIKTSTHQQIKTITKKMKNYIIHDEWKIIEDKFRPEYNEISESLCSIGNGRMGQRANFEEKYSGHTLQGSYVAGVYYPDKTRVGWWKNGYPEYFAKVLNAANWIGINITIDGEELDLATCEVGAFSRILDMKTGVLHRSFEATLASGKKVAVTSRRFCSIADDQIGAIEYAIKAINFSGNLTIEPYVDFDVANKDSNYDEKFWVEIAKETAIGSAYNIAETKKTAFHVCTGMQYQIVQNGTNVDLAKAELIEKEKYNSNIITVATTEGTTTTIYKYASNISSFNYEKSEILEKCKEATNRAFATGFDSLLADQIIAWAAKWEESDITIEGDVAAQQGIRFNIFHMNQTYTGEDERLNIGPKGFTGEKYGGSTYWDTEAYCLPFYLATADEKVARQLLVYRYKHLQRAIENAEKLGFSDGAALYPMVTMNGEECHNEWEITFEEIHRNGAIAFAIYDYIRYTGDEKYLTAYGLEVLVGIARFWAQRVNWSEDKKQYVMLGVTGPNEYENNVNNNWYTNHIACWTMDYAREAIEFVKNDDAEKFAAIAAKINLDEATETAKWADISEKMYFPANEEMGIFLQQDNFLDKEIIKVKDLDPKHLPLNQKWSWDRILRSCFIKQADVLQGLYLFEEQFSEEEHRRNFDFYEPITVHESSLSPCVHVILASKLGKEEKAYEMYVRTARLDLDDYNNDTEDGLHITSMAGTWMSVTKGFGGMRVYDGMLHFAPIIPKQWKSFDFNIRFRGAILDIKTTQEMVTVTNHSDMDLVVKVYGNEVEVKGHSAVEVKTK
jgi:maltose phosphorylase